ncbi:MAG: alkaline phosphatase family protein [Anaerolineae bacterium]|nr:alkaline phosphatase family protein [Anaerolineae bacterium]
MGRKHKSRVAIIGLDCAEPSLVFERYAADLPTFTRLREQGVWGRLESVIPAITVPAWSCMMSGQDPGALGIYGFRNRADYSYDHLMVANGDAVQQPRLWDILSRYDKTSIVLNVPGTYPPRPLNGQMVSCFLTPDADAEFTYPANLKAQILAKFSEYPFDVKDFRTHEKDRLLKQITAMTRTHFEVARWLAKESDWDLFAMVEIGLDRIHHAFWSYMDSTHRNYEPDSPYGDAIREYYRLLDSEIASLLPILGEDTAIFVVSDHGAKRMDGGIAINEWLIREGYLTLAEPYPQDIRKPEALKINWAKTLAWGEGGYYGRLFLNLQGREPQGVIAPDDVPRVLAEIKAKLEALGDGNGQPIGTHCFLPGEIYPVVEGIPPDLLVYFGNLSWRSLGTVGWNRVHVLENDTGPDDANHAQHGLIIAYDPKNPANGRQLENAHLLQITPSVLDKFGIEVPKAMRQPPLALK